MSAESPDEPPMAALSGSQKASHKTHHHRHKSELGKRARSDDNADDGRNRATQKHKKAKKEAEDDASASTEEKQREEDVGSVTLAKKEKKKSKHRASQVAPEVAPVEVALGMTQDTTKIAPLGEAVESTSKKSKRPRHSHKRHGDLDSQAPEQTPLEDRAPRAKEKKSRKHRGGEGGGDALTQGTDKDPRGDKDRLLAPDVDLMDVDTATHHGKDDGILRPSHAPSEVDFPFFKQFLSLFVPLYPVGFSKPVTSAAEQHLAPMLNHYSSLLQGVVLGYRNPCISEQARHPKEPATDDTPAILESIGEYAVGFGRLTAEVDLFKPSRGAWMEGEIVLQSEGNVGVKCFERFNASIEARRLPPGWKWIDLYDGASGDGLRDQTGQSRQGKGSGGDEEEDTARSPMQVDSGFAGGDDDQLAHQMHVTGYWVDAEGRRVRGKVWFQIKSYETGLAGDYGYISIVGTMLNEKEEHKLDVQQRLDKRKGHRRHGGLLRPESRRVPEFSMTTFGKEDEEENSEQRQVVSKSRPSTPDD